MSDIIERAKSAFGRGIIFSLNAGLSSPNNALPEDHNGRTNCISFVAWAARVDVSGIPFPRVDWIYNNWPIVEHPVVGALVCRPSLITDGRFDPGAIGVISQIMGGYITGVITAHPKINGVVAEVTGDDILKLRMFGGPAPHHVVDVP